MKIETMTLRELEALETSVAAAKAKRREAERAAVIERLRAEARQGGFRLEDLLNLRRAKVRTAPKPAVIFAKGVKYADPKTGNTWKGRGRRPLWLTNKLNKGQPLESFAIR